ncbi:hypothetical protein [Delftia acidovorans]|uniref:Uncharacterized protein n=1 Tax=Delftia acidovorans TaxID=80866 RepID=A0AAJ2R343_DELAC|nr:hypothetical protein [Delftia acidovorans]MDX4957274.1 hypothetical protein [Delftia acidovorans]
MLKPQLLFKPRASGLFNLMTDPRSKSEVLSEGAKTYLDKCAKELFYDYTTEAGSKETAKGLEVEDQAIELFNSVFFLDHKKNTERRETDYLTGECDIFTGSEIIDIKSSWSIATFPATVRAGDKKEYEWQARAYMHLWDVPRATIAYCLVDTPDHLVGYEDENLHIVSHISPELRITRVRYERDDALEKKLIERCKLAQDYLREELFRIESEHRGI